MQCDKQNVIPAARNPESRHVMWKGQREFNPVLGQFEAIQIKRESLVLKRYKCSSIQRWLSGIEATLLNAIKDKAN